MCVRACVRACVHVCMFVCVCVYACICVCVAKPVAVELRCHATKLKFNAKVGEWGPGLRFKSRIFRICLYLRKDTSWGYTCLSGHFF